MAESRGGRQRAAVWLCVRIYKEGKRGGKFRLAMAFLLRDLGKREAASIVEAALKLYWVKRTNSEVELTATGIYVAKNELEEDSENSASA